MIGRGHGEIRMDPLHVLGVEMRRLANVLTIVVAVSAGLTACAPPKKDLDPKLASLLLETKTPWEIKPPSDLKVLLDGTRKIGREDRWLETMRSAVSPTAVKKGLAIPEGHLARYEKEMARALRDKDMDRIGEVNGEIARKDRITSIEEIDAYLRAGTYTIFCVSLAHERTSERSNHDR